MHHPVYLDLSGFIPYAAVYQNQEETRRHGYWIPGVAVIANITSIERDTSEGVHIFNPYVSIFDSS